jgi:hypothetical protein
LTNGNFRQYILKYKSFIEIVIHGRPTYYKLKGITLPGDSKRLTQKVTGDGMMEILYSLREQPPSIHDLKLKFHSNLHGVLLDMGHTQHPSNHGILLKIPQLDYNITSKVLVYPNTVQIDIGCTFRPFVYGISGVTNLAFVLGRIYQCIFFMAGNAANIPDILQWIITHYHFGKDGTETISGQMFHRTFEDTASGLVRFYSKLMKNGDIIPRVEKICTPGVTLDQEINKMIAQEVMVL